MKPLAFYTCSVLLVLKRHRTSLSVTADILCKGIDSLKKVPSVSIEIPKEVLHYILHLKGKYQRELLSKQEPFRLQGRF